MKFIVFIVSAVITFYLAVELGDTLAHEILESAINTIVVQVILGIIFFIGGFIAIMSILMAGKNFGYVSYIWHILAMIFAPSILVALFLLYLGYDIIISDTKYITLLISIAFATALYCKRLVFNFESYALSLTEEEAGNENDYRDKMFGMMAVSVDERPGSLFLLGTIFFEIGIALLMITMFIITFLTCSIIFEFSLSVGLVISVVFTVLLCGIMLAAGKSGEWKRRKLSVSERLEARGEEE